MVKPRKQKGLNLCWKQCIKKVVCLNTQRYFNVIIDLSLKVMSQKCLKNTIIFEEQQQNTSKLTTRYMKMAYADICISLANNMEIKKIPYLEQKYIATRSNSSGAGNPVLYYFERWD